MSKNTPEEQSELAFSNFEIRIPAFIAQDKKLTGEEKILVGTIVGLSSKFGFCIAKNEYLGKITGKTASAVEKQIRNLYKKKTIKNTTKNRRIRELTLTQYFNNLNRHSDGSNVIKDDLNRQIDEFEPSNRRLLPIIYIYLYNKGQIKDIDPSFDPAKKSDTELKNILFKAFWKIYPNKVKKKKSMETFMKLSDENIEKLLKVMPIVKSYYENKHKAPFVPAPPHPTTFMNDERWDDETFQPQKKSQEGGETLSGPIDSSSSLVDSVVMKIGEISNGDGEEIMNHHDRELLMRVGLSIEEAVEVVDLEQRKGLKLHILTLLNQNKAKTA